MSWLQNDQSDRDYVQRLQQESPQHYQLLCVLALAIRIEPLLLRNARLQFVPGSDIELESEIWFSSIMHSRNAKACIIRAGVARALADELANDQQAYDRAWTFVQTHTQHWVGQDQLEQQLRLAARTHDTNALQSGYNKILNTLLHTPDAGSKRDLSRWIKGAIPSILMPHDQSETAHLLFQYTAAALGLPTSWSANHQAELASMPKWLVDALPTSKENTLGIELHTAALACVATDSAKHRITVNLPLPTPVLINTDQESTPRWESLWLGKKIRLSPNYKWLSLQTLEGQLYRFTVNNFKTPSEDNQTNQPALQLLFMPEDRELATRISELLKQQGIDIELIPEPLQPEPMPLNNRPILRLWSRASANYWQQTSTNAEQGNLSRGLLVRTDPQVQLPLGFNAGQSIDLIELQNPEHTENAVTMIRDWLAAPQADVNEPNSVIDTLLKEIESPETKPRRRLAIGDQLAELGDPRKGVGVVDYQVIEYAPEVQRLLNELNDINTQPPRRLEIGDLLAEMGDPRPGVGLDENGLPEIDWVEIPAGPFIYGEGETQQTLDLPRYKISRYPVTNSQFQAFIDDGGYLDERWWQDSIKPEPIQGTFNQANRPRETVDWFEARAFTRWLSARLRLNVNLSTEQQWEKAARGQEGLVYPWGNEFCSGFANCNEAFADRGPYYLGETSGVGIYPQGVSPYKIADLAGNVREWCLNDYDRPERIDSKPILQKDKDSKVLKVSEGSVLRSDGRLDSRVLRGGSWSNEQATQRSATRVRGTPVYRGGDIGFRLIQD